jgi:limonene-1,2-epoxide hydrolase
MSLARYDDGKLVINAQDFIDALSDEDRVHLIEHAAFDDRVFEMVVARLLDEGCFEGYWWTSPDRCAQMLREKLAASDEFGIAIYRIAIAKLMHERDDAVADKERHVKWAYALYHSKDDSCMNPQLPDWIHIAPADATAIDAELEVLKVEADKRRVDYAEWEARQ